MGMALPAPGAKSRSGCGTDFCGRILISYGGDDDVSSFSSWWGRSLGDIESRWRGHLPMDFDKVVGVPPGLGRTQS